MATPATPCLDDDALLALASGAGALAGDPIAEAHVATCATCSALLAGAVHAVGDATPREAWNARAGATLGPYRLEAQLGRGGMGVVYRAHDARLDRAVAVKLLHPGVAGLADEARAAAAIDHRAVVAIHDVGVADDGTPYVAMELVDGEALRSVIAAGPLGVARARELAIELADALAAAHARGVVHRDLKPENLVLARGGLRVLDFGLARRAGDDALGGGTPGYAAPEQLRGGAVDARADVFAVGAIALELATGARAFPGATAADRVAATLKTPPPDDALASLGPLAPVIARCLARDPRDRFQSAADLAWALRATIAATPAPTPRPARRLSRRAVLAGGAAALATGALGFLLGRRRATGADEPARVLVPISHRAGRVYTARFTREGRHVLYGAAWEAEPLAIRDFDVASRVTITLDLAPPCDVLAISPRDELAVSFEHRFVDHQSVRGHLALVPLAGGPARAIADDVGDADFLPPRPPSEITRPPTGDLVVARPRPAGFALELPLGTTLVEEPGWITHVRVSPDGAHVAYLRHPQTNDDGGELVVLDLATRATRVLGPTWASIAGVAWDPRGDALYVTAAEETLQTRLRRVTLDGAVTAIATPTTGRTRVHDVAPDGTLLITTDAWHLRAIAGARDVSQSEVSYVTDISADGTQVAIGELGGSGNGAYLVPYTGGRPLRLGPGYPVAISPSGQRIAINTNATDALAIYTTGSGETSKLAAPGFVTFGRWLDERTLLVAFEHRLYVLAVGAAPVLVADTGAPFALDPARTRAAWLDRGAHQLHVMTVADRATRVVPGTFAREEVVGWLREPDAIVVRSTTIPIVLTRIDPDTGARTPHREIQPPSLGLKAVDTLILHADGERVAYSYGQEVSQLFAMLPPGRATVALE